jgi:ribosomal protein S12 methylthiotransferase
MELQQGISLEKNQALVGKTLAVLVEGWGEVQSENGKKGKVEHLSLGRSYRDAPEIDGLVMIAGDAPVGSLVQAKIDGAMIYDLSGYISPA